MKRLIFVFVPVALLALVLDTASGLSPQTANPEPSRSSGAPAPTPGSNATILKGKPSAFQLMRTNISVKGIYGNSCPAGDLGQNDAIAMTGISARIKNDAPAGGQGFAASGKAKLVVYMLQLVGPAQRVEILRDFGPIAVGAQTMVNFSTATSLVQKSKGISVEITLNMGVDTVPADNMKTVNQCYPLTGA